MQSGLFYDILICITGLSTSELPIINCSDILFLLIFLQIFGRSGAFFT